MDFISLDRLVNYYSKRLRLGGGVVMDLRGYSKEEQEYIQQKLDKEMEKVIQGERRALNG